MESIIKEKVLEAMSYLVGTGFLMSYMDDWFLDLVTAQQVRSIYTTHQICRLENLDVNFYINRALVNQ
jgi:hypothetical protein